MRSLHFPLATGFLLLTLIPPVAAQAPARHFDRAIAPLLAARCLSCHQGSRPKGGLDLSGRARALSGGKNGKAIVPGQPEKSLLWQRIQANEMPPRHPLSEAEKKLLRQWLAGGAKWGSDPIDPFRYTTDKRAGYDWWSLRPLSKPGLPRDPDDQWSLNEIDRFVLQRLKARGLSHSRRAGPRALVRRLYFDLLGLPAPPEVIHRFSQNPSQKEWIKLVDQLLASSHYGERWARHWLDVARFGETHGYEYNVPRAGAWHYRDWVIRAFNSDLPYNRFVQMQVAGDVLEPGSLEGSAAVGFLVAGIHNTVVGQSPAMKKTARMDELEEIAGALAQTFLGLTVNCARCHDHKFDPISTKEYYQFIASLDGVNHGARKLRLSSSREEEGEWQRQKERLQSRLLDQVASRNGKVTISANRLELKDSVAANQKGVRYQVSFRLSPSVWANPAQATAEHHGLVVRIRGSGNEVVARRSVPVQSWSAAGRRSRFQEHSFTYTGNGNGPVRIQISPYPLHSHRFGGAIDDLVIRRQKQIVFEEHFNRLKHHHPPGAQADTGHRVYYGSSLSRWHHSGTNAIHAIEHGPGDLAVQLFNGSTKGPIAKAQTTVEKKLRAEIDALSDRINQARPQPVSVFTVAPRRPGVMRLLRRGDVTRPGEEVAPGVLRAVNGIAPSAVAKTAGDADRRRNLALWLSHRDNGPFHRVIVNRIWHWHFGRGIVATPNDLGFNGSRPTHPALLEWLAQWFREQDYSIKKLHRLILTSATWQQSSQARPGALRVDKSNQLLWRQNPRRVEAEVLRDSILEVSGALNRKKYGSGFRDVRIEKVGSAHYYIPMDPVGDAFNRRTLYRWQARGQRSALLETFDCPDPSTTAPVRNVTTTPSQALSHWNDSFVLRMAKAFARRVKQEVGSDPAKQARRAWQLALGRLPDRDEEHMAIKLVQKHDLALLARALFNSNEFIWIE